MDGCRYKKAAARFDPKNFARRQGNIFSYMLIEAMQLILGLQGYDCKLHQIEVISQMTAPIWFISNINYLVSSKTVRTNQIK